MREDAIRPGRTPLSAAPSDAITERAPAPMPAEATSQVPDANLQVKLNRSTWRPRLPSILLVGVPLFLVLFGFVIPLIQIQLRLSRNGTLARQVTEALQQRFPGAKCTGVPSYEKETIYITVREGIDKATRPDLERWLGAHKAERRINPEIWLTYGDDDIDVPPLRF